MVTRCHLAALESGNRVCTLLPRNGAHWLPMVEDVASSTAFHAKMDKMSDTVLQHDEWYYTSMDATLKLCMKLLGQTSYRAPKRVGDDAPFRDDVAWRRLLTIRGQELSS